MVGLQAVLPKTALDEWNMRLHEWPEVNLAGRYRQNHDCLKLPERPEPLSNLS
jgi:hypothetical protein